MGRWYEIQGDNKRAKGCYEKGGNMRGVGIGTGKQVEGEVWTEWKYGTWEGNARRGGEL